MTLHREEIGGRAVFLHDYRIKYRYKHWIGRPDPSGMGVAYYLSDSLDWIRSKVRWLAEHGDKVLAVQQWDDETNKWKTIKEDVT